MISNQEKHQGQKLEVQLDTKKQLRLGLNENLVSDHNRAKTSQT